MESSLRTQINGVREFPGTFKRWLTSTTTNNSYVLVTVYTKLYTVFHLHLN